jgi:hypothetical protein
MNRRTCQAELNRAGHKVKVLSVWAKNSRDLILVTRGRYKGQPLISIRVWYRDQDGELAPGREGISIRNGDLKTALKGLRRADRLAAHMPN